MDTNIKSITAVPDTMSQNLFLVEGLKGLNAAQIAKAELATVDFERRFEVLYVVDKTFDLKSLLLTEGNLERRRAEYDTEFASYKIFDTDLNLLWEFKLHNLHVCHISLATDVYANQGLAVRIAYRVSLIV